MVQRKTLPASHDCAISVTTEQMADGSWGVVTSVKHMSGTTESVTDLPIPEQRFATEADAEAFGFAQGKEWIEKNTPRAA
jgi:hypothetical protein